MSRRRFLFTGMGAGAGLLLARCKTPGAELVSPSSAAVQRVEDQRLAAGGAVREFKLVAAPAQIQLDGREVTTWAYGGSVPGPEIRVKAGEVLQVAFRNDLVTETSIHWHGIALRNNMDGVPPVTQSAVAARSDFLYRFAVPDPGTYFFHPHTGLQLDRGLYAPLIVEDPAEPGGYDQEIVLVLDDWTDGVGMKPEKLFSDLKSANASMPGMNMGGGGSEMEEPSPEAMAGPLKGDAGDVSYPLYLMNGRSRRDPQTFDVRAGQRIRLRVINAAADTAFRFAVQDHAMQVTHTDGFPVNPAPADAVLVGMGERFDALLTVEGAGAYAVVAAAEGKSNLARAILRSGTGDAPPPEFEPPNLNGNLVQLANLSPAEAVRLPDKAPDRSTDVVLGGDMRSYTWTINGKIHEESEPLVVEEGERVRLVFRNETTMFHPMHLHGHTFQVRRGSEPGPRKDTVMVLPDETVTVEFDADNPGEWALHCHNLYHQEAGMMVNLGYLGQAT